MGRREVDELPVVAKDMAELSFAKLCGTLSNGLEHRLDIGGRAADDAEHIAGRSLILQGLLEFALACLFCLEQPRVLDGDQRLIGKGADECDLLLSERLDEALEQHNHANRNAIAQQRYAEGRLPVGSWSVRVFGVGSDIWHMDRALLQRCSASNGAAARNDGVAATQNALVGGSRRQVVDTVSQQSEISKIRLAQTDRRLHNRIQHGLKVRW